MRGNASEVTISEPEPALYSANDLADDLAELIHQGYVTLAWDNSRPEAKIRFQAVREAC